MLLARVDALTGRMTELVEEVRSVCEQLCIGQLQPSLRCGIYGAAGGMVAGAFDAVAVGRRASRFARQSGAGEP